MAPDPIKLKGVVTYMGPCKFIRSGDPHGPKTYKFISFGNLHGPKPYTLHVTKPYKFICFGGCYQNL